MAARARVISFRIIPTMLKAATGGFDLVWDVQSAGFTPTFMPQMAHTEIGPWTDLINTPTAGYSVTGVGPKQLSFQEDFFFRLLVKDTSTLVITSDITQACFHQNRHDFLLYREMLRREDLGLRKFNGEPGILFRRIVYGTPCTDCRDETLGGPASSECANCFGTGFEGGYYPGVQLLADITDESSSPNNTTEEPAGESELRICSALLPAYPVIKFKDVFVEIASGQRHEATAAASDTFRGFNIRQIVTLSRLPISDPAYQIPLS